MDSQTDIGDRPGFLVSHFQGRQEDEQISGWEELWDAERSDLWDRGKPSAPLRQLIEELDSGGLKRLQHGRLKALVPGCGRGYDVVLLALHGFDAYGLEVSSTAISAAQKYAERQLVHPSDEYFGPNTDKSRWGKPGEAQFIEGDFFSDFWEGKVDKGTGFDVIYDYTFLCALPPNLRKPWAQRMRQLLSPSGILVCLEFPLWKSLDVAGPPWGLKGVYWDLLVGGRCGRISDVHLHTAERGEKAEYVQPVAWDRTLYIKPRESYPQGRGQDMLSVWKMK